MEAGRTVNAFRLHRFSVPCQGTRSTAQTSILRKRRRDSLDCGKATYEHAEFLVLLMDIVLFRGLQALWDQVIPFDFVVHGAEGDMQE